MTSTVMYKGALRTEMLHLQSNSLVETDAPTDNQGKGERFSPTDLVATALASCMLTTMGIKVQLAGWDVDLTGTKAAVTKVMKADPRRIAEIVIHIVLPASVNADAKQRAILENTAKTCPVERSLHPDLVVNVSFDWQ